MNTLNPKQVGAALAATASILYAACALLITVVPKDIAIAAHLGAIKGEKTAIDLDGEFKGMFLQVLPLTEEDGEIIGCVAIINSVQS